MNLFIFYKHVCVSVVWHILVIALYFLLCIRYVACDICVNCAWQHSTYMRTHSLAGASKCIPCDAKCVTEIFGGRGGGKNKEVGGTKFTFYPFVLSENKCIKPIAEFLGGQK